MRSKWPLYLVIIIAAAASIATQYISWSARYRYAGPVVELSPDFREDIVPFTIRFAPGYDWADIRVFGSARYEGAAEELRVSLVELGERTLATQFQQVEGDGIITIQLSTWDTTLHCAPGETEVCEQELALVFGTGGARTGVYVFDWELTVGIEGEGDAPADLFYEVEMPRGRLLDAPRREDALTAAGE